MSCGACSGRQLKAAPCDWSADRYMPLRFHYLCFCNAVLQLLLCNFCSATNYLLYYFKRCLSLATAATLLPLLAPLWYYTPAFLQLLIGFFCTDSFTSTVIFRAAQSRNTNATLLRLLSPTTLLSRCQPSIYYWSAVCVFATLDSQIWC